MENVKSSPIINESMYINKLPNGLNCYIIPKKDYLEKQAMVCVNYGSNDSKFQKNGEIRQTPEGVAHFLEHKLFEDEKLIIFDEFTKLGASVNAFTNFTTTAYYFNCIDNFSENLRLLLSFTTTPYFTHENVEKEKGIIAQEINMYDDSPFWKIYINMLENLYHNCPVRNNIAGSVSSIEKIDKDILFDCYNSFYRPENMALVCVGDFDKEEIYSIAGEYFTNAKTGGVKRVYGQEPKSIVKPFVQTEMSLARPMFAIGFKDNTPNISSGKKIAAIKILMDIVAGESSEFFNNQYEKGKVDGPFSTDYINSSFYGTAMFAGYGEDPRRLRVDLLEECLRIYASGGVEKRFEQILNKHKGRFIRNFNSIDSIATSQVDLFSKNLDIFDLVDAYENIDVEYLKKILNSVFTEEYCVLSVAMPKVD